MDLKPNENSVFCTEISENETVLFFLGKNKTKTIEQK